MLFNPSIFIMSSVLMYSIPIHLCLDEKWECVCVGVRMGGSICRCALFYGFSWQIIMFMSEKKLLLCVDWYLVALTSVLSCIQQRVCSACTVWRLCCTPAWISVYSCIIRRPSRLHSLYSHVNPLEQLTEICMYCFCQSGSIQRSILLLVV